LIEIVTPEVLAATLVVGGFAATSAEAATTQTYIVLYKSNAVASNAASAITRASGKLVYSYPQIGVVIAQSSSTSFRSALSKDSAVEGVAATSGFAIQLPNQNTNDAAAPVTSLPVSDTDNLSGLQWDMQQIHTPEAHAITGGSPSIVVGDIDTGLDYTHPDLRRTSTSPTAFPASAECRTRARRPGTTTTATAPTPRGRSRRRRTASASWAWLRT
jgi:hypothetical protein